MATNRHARRPDPAPPDRPATWLPRPISWTCGLTPRGGGFDGHVHADHDEICLVANDGTMIRHAGVERPCRPGTVFLFRRGEFHGYRNRPHQEPHLWLVHYQPDAALDAACPALATADPEQRVWELSADELAGYQALFARLMAESLHAGGPGHAAALSGWLRLILVQAARWRRRGDARAALPAGIAGDPDLANLWEVINQHVEAPDDDFSGALARRVPNYDSLRHRFRKVYGRSPRDLLQNLRIERAKSLLLESDAAIGAIAERLGYARPAEFARAFARHVGQTPGAFRLRPLGDGATRGEP